MKPVTVNDQLLPHNKHNEILLTKTQEILKVKRMHNIT